MSITEFAVKTITVPAFSVRGIGVDAQVPETDLELVREDSGGYSVVIQTGAMSRAVIGTIRREGTGWTAEFRHGELRARFTGDHFPVRTGKHTQRYALSFMLAIAAGLSASRATYDLMYEGVRA